jgi:hypothetical protein
MHEVGILDPVRERVTRRRGGVAAFDQLSPRQSRAHRRRLAERLHGRGPGCGSTYRPHNRSQCQPHQRRPARRGWGCRLYAAHMDAEAVRTWPVFFEHFCGTPEHRARTIETFTPDNFGHSLWSELDVTQEDLVLMERRFRSRLLGSACPFAGTWHRYAHHFRHPVAGLLRIRGEGCDDDELQGVLYHGCLRDADRREHGGRYRRWRTHFATCGTRSRC